MIWAGILYLATFGVFLEIMYLAPELGWHD